MGDEFFVVFFPVVNFLGEEGSFQEVNLSEEIIHWRNLPEFLYKFFLCVLLSSFRLSYMRGVV